MKLLEIHLAVQVECFDFCIFSRLKSQSIPRSQTQQLPLLIPLGIGVSASNSITPIGAIRTRYLVALRAADQGQIDGLIEFARS